MSDARENDRDTNKDSPLKTSGILDGVANILGRLGELAEKGEELRQQAEAKGQHGSESKGVFDFSVKFGNANGPSGRPPSRGQSPTVRPVKSHSPTPATTARPTPVDAMREPHVDLFEEDDHLLCIAEMPGVGEETVKLSLVENQLSINGKSTRTEFAAKINLPVGEYGSPTFQLNNGILEVKLCRQSSE